MPGLGPGKQPPKEDIEEITSMMSGRIIGSRAGCVKRMCVCFILSSLLIVSASFFYKVFWNFGTFTDVFLWLFSLF